MCYICEARGTVGKNYKAAQKEIAAALRVYTYKHCPDHMCCATLSGNKPFRKPLIDWTKPAPASQRLWTLAELKEYGEAWRREHSNS